MVKTSKNYIKPTVLNIIISCEQIFLLESKYFPCKLGHLWNLPLSGAFVFHKHIFFLAINYLHIRINWQLKHFIIYVQKIVFYFQNHYNTPRPFFSWPWTPGTAPRMFYGVPCVKLSWLLCTVMFVIHICVKTV